ncbi:transposase [Clostridium sp. ZBS20]|uniref:transposase n=1 Tax=Clostridium sp. ZBS20 TaxID=2949966 RepID=UPI00338D8BAA
MKLSSLKYFNSLIHPVILLSVKNRKGQLKPGYNVQIAVESEYVTGVGIFQDRNDIATLIPMLKNMQKKLGRKHLNVIADSGYESEENYLFLESNNQIPYIKPQTYEKWKK